MQNTYNQNLDNKVWENNLDEVKKILSEGVNPNQINSSGLTPLGLAVAQNNKEMIECLIKNGAELNPIDAAPLLIAVIKNNFETANFLISLGADPNHGVGSAQVALIQLLRANASFEQLKYMLDKGADPNGRSHDGETVLMFAVRMNNLKLVELLLEKGANPNGYMEIDAGVGAPYKDYPLAIATSYAYTDIVTLLQEHGAKKLK